MSMMNANVAATTAMTANKPLDFELPEMGEAEFSNEELAEDMLNMKKMDLHIHTVSTKRDKPFEFSIEKLKGYVIQEKVDLIAITNHNLFDAQQFSDITNALPIKVFPGIEVDIEGGHLIVITDPSDIDDFTEKCAKVYRLNGTSEDSYISEAQFMEIFNDLGKYILIPHYEKEPKLPLERVPQISPYIKCGEACSAKKFIYMQSRSEKLVPVLFSDWRVEEKAPFPLGRQAFASAFSDCIKRAIYSRKDRFVAQRIRK